MTRTVIGIFTEPRRENRFPSYYKHFIKEGKKIGAQVFLFQPTDEPQWREGSWKGYVPAASGKWVERSFPIPDGIINRFGRFRQPEAVVDQSRRILTDSRHLIANSTVNDKLHLYQQLIRFPALHRWLPETAAYSPEACLNLLSRHAMLYLKPINGTGGRGIYRIEPLRKERFRLTGHDENRSHPIDEVLPSNALAARVTNLLGNEPYLVQQGVDLHLKKNRNADLRLLLQKVADEWKVTGKAFRIGKANSPVSNLHGGGKGVLAKPFLKERFGRKKTHRILKECDELAIEIAKAIEACYGRMVDLGFDIGVDTSGRVWLIEVNTMPQRNILKTTGQKEAFKLSYRRPIEQVIHLSRSKINTPQES